MPPAPTFCLEPTTGRTLRSAAFLCALAMAALVYLLLALPGAHRADCPSDCHDAWETVHLPRGTGDVDVAHRVLQAERTVVVEAAPPGASGPALVALVTVLVAALLASFPVAASRVFHATVEAVLGVGRWHRTVVLHI